MFKRAIILALHRRVTCLIERFPQILSYFRARRSHWENLQPTSGRPYSSALRELDSQWEDLSLSGKTMIQTKTLTTDEEMQELAKRAGTN